MNWDIQYAFLNWRLNAIPVKILVGFWDAQIHKWILKFTWKGKGLRMAITTLKKKVQGVHDLDFKAYYNNKLFNTWKDWHK